MAKKTCRAKHFPHQHTLKQHSTGLCNATYPIILSRDRRFYSNKCLLGNNPSLFQTTRTCLSGASRCVLGQARAKTVLGQNRHPQEETIQHFYWHAEQQKTQWCDRLHKSVGLDKELCKYADVPRPQYSSYAAESMCSLWTILITI